MSGTPSGVVNMVFNTEVSVLSNVSPKTHTINMNEFDFLSCDLLDDVIQLQDDELEDCINSPGNSDSGLSLDNCDDWPSTLPTLTECNHIADHSYTTLASPNDTAQFSPPYHYQSDNSPFYTDQSDMRPSVEALNDKSTDISDYTLDANFDILDSMDDVLDDILFNSEDFSINVDLPDIDDELVNQLKPSLLTTLTRVTTCHKQTLPVTMKDVNQLNTPTSQSYDNLAELRLSDEEKLLMVKEGFMLPAHLPLTKEEERQLKAVRRKIRNKISAKESRKRKMTYIEGLEKRVKISTVENLQLRKKVTTLEQNNTSLIGQLKKLQEALKGRSKKSAHSGTCIAVLAVSFMFIILPSYNPISKLWGEAPLPTTVLTPGNSRSLLHSRNEQRSRVTVDHDANPYGVTSWPRPPWDEPQQSAIVGYTERVPDRDNKSDETDVPNKYSHDRSDVNKDELKGRESGGEIETKSDEIGDRSRLAGVKVGDEREL